MIRSCAQPGRLGQLRRPHRRLEHRLDHHVAGVARLGEPGVRVHQLGQERLVERAPVDPDPDRLAVLDGDPDDRLEVLVVALRADVARIDPVLREARRHLRVLRQEQVAVVVEVADDRHVDAEAAHLADHLRHGRGGRLVVDRDPDELAAGVGELGDLDRRASASAVSVFVIDWTTIGWRRPTRIAADVDGHRRPAPRPEGIGRAHADPRPPRRDDVEARDPDQEREQEDEADHVGQLLGPQADPLPETRLSTITASARRRAAGTAGCSRGRGWPTGSPRRTA